MSNRLSVFLGAAVRVVSKVDEKHDCVSARHDHRPTPFASRRLPMAYILL